MPRGARARVAGQVVERTGFAAGAACCAASTCGSWDLPGGTHALGENCDSCCCYSAATAVVAAGPVAVAGPAVVEVVPACAGGPALDLGEGTCWDGMSCVGGLGMMVAAAAAAMFVAYSRNLGHSELPWHERTHREAFPPVVME